MKNVKLVFVTLIAAAAIVIFWQNREDVSLNLIFDTITMPRALLLTITLAIGFVLGAIVVFRRRKS